MTTIGSRGVLLLSALAVGLAGGLAFAQPPRPVADTASVASARAFGDAFAAVAERVSESVVSIHVEAVDDRQRPTFPGFGPRSDGIVRGGGSGVVVRPDGVILTNHHVVANARRIEVHRRDGRSFQAEVVGLDRATDLAVLRIPAQGLRAAAFADSNRVRPGQWAIAIGAPFGLEMSVTTGVVSSVGRGLGLNEIEDYVQTDASINPGNSGGPLVNLDGEVIGINTMILGRGSGIGFAVSSELAQRVTSQILRHGRVRRAWIGVQFQELTPELAAAFSMSRPSGALVADVIGEGPAASSGLQAGDVIVSVDGRPVREARDLLREVLRRDVGARLTLGVQRRGRSVRVVLTTAERPEAPSTERARRPTPPPADAGPLDGLRLEPSPDGARVAAVRRGSDAERAGLRQNDVVVEADGSPVRAPAEVVRALADGTALLRVRRGRGALYTVLAD